MLWEEGFWMKYNDRKLAPEGNYILAYFRTDNKSTVRDAAAYGRKKNLPVYYINYNHAEPDVKNIRPESVEEWISLFVNADTIFTANKARMESLSRELGIEEREGTQRNILRDIPVDFHRINGMIAQKREESWNLLKAALLS